MKQDVAPMGVAIKIVTCIVLALDAAFYVIAIRQPMVLAGAAALSAVILICYWFWTPVAYELSGKELIVFFRIGRKRYGPVIRCAIEEMRLIDFAIRLFANGGLFSGSGIFWSRRLGIFRAYVTNTGGDLVIVETARTKVVISPENPRLLAASGE
jgi:hypothetical protein